MSAVEGDPNPGTGASAAAASASKRKAPARPAKEPKTSKEPKEALKRARPSGGSSKKGGKASGDSAKDAADGQGSSEARAEVSESMGKVDVAAEGEDIGVAAKPDPSVGAQIVVIHAGSSSLRVGVALLAVLYVGFHSRS